MHTKNTKSPCNLNAYRGRIKYCKIINRQHTQIRAKSNDKCENMMKVNWIRSRTNSTTNRPTCIQFLFYCGRYFSCGEHKQRHVIAEHTKRFTPFKSLTILHSSFVSFPLWVCIALTQMNWEKVNLFNIQLKLKDQKAKWRCFAMKYCKSNVRLASYGLNVMRVKFDMPWSNSFAFCGDYRRRILRGKFGQKASTIG